MAESVSKISGGQEVLRRLESLEETGLELTRKLERNESRVDNLVDSYRDALAHIGKRMDKSDQLEEERHKSITSELRALSEAKARNELPFGWIIASIGALIAGALILVARHVFGAGIK